MRLHKIEDLEDPYLLEVASITLKRFGRNDIIVETCSGPLLLVWRTSIRKRPRQAIRDFALGIRYRYPLCCIINFCIDTFFGKTYAGLKRGFYKIRGGPCVPCIICQRKRQDIKLWVLILSRFSY